MQRPRATKIRRKKSQEITAAIGQQQQHKQAAVKTKKAVNSLRHQMNMHKIQRIYLNINYIGTKLLLRVTAESTVTQSLLFRSRFAHRYWVYRLQMRRIMQHRQMNFVSIYCKIFTRICRC